MLKTRIANTFRNAQVWSPRGGQIALYAIALAIALLAAWQALAIVQSLAVLVAGSLLRATASLSVIRQGLLLLPFDPIYTGAALETAGNIRMAGVVAMPPLGEILHGLLPALFSAPEQIEGGWTQALILPGSSVMARGLAVFLGDVAMLAFGIGLYRASRRRAKDRIVTETAESVGAEQGDAPVHLGKSGRLTGTFSATTGTETGRAEGDARNICPETVQTKRDVRAITPGMAATETGTGTIQPLFTRYPSSKALRWGIAIIGLLAQVFVAARIFTNQPALTDVEALGLSFAVGVLLPSVTGRSAAFSDLQTYVPGIVLTSVLALVLLLLAYVAARIILALLRLAQRRLVPGFAHHMTLPRACPPRIRRLAPVISGLLVACILFAVLPTQLEPAPDLVAVIAGEETVTDIEAVTDIESEPASQVVVPRPGPSRVMVVGREFNFTYIVNGEPQVIHGMGYNPRYAMLDREARAERYDRDFALMSRAGVNTVFGWTAAEFDGLLLDKAQEYGLGVSMPFELSPAAEYSDPKVQSDLTEDVLKWVQTYRGHPALRMWSVGNEVLHKVVFPSWFPLKKNSNWALTQANEFAKFYVRLIEVVHNADPDHPVILRDAEDGYLQWVRDALHARTSDHSWFIYGVNIYTNRIKDVVGGWPKRGVDRALLVSEFAPAGLRPQDRPEGFRRMWEVIRTYPDWTIGGVPYVWSTVGPEEVDRAFGLVDGEGKPVDGSLDAIGSLYMNDNGATSRP